MRIIRSISEDEMIATFLTAELDSARFRDVVLATLRDVGAKEQLVRAPQLQDAQENAQRRAALGKYRGYGLGVDYFQGFPDDVTWERVALTREEVARIKYIDYDYWVELSGGSRLALDGAHNAMAGKVVFGVASNGLTRMADALRQGAQFPTLILVGRSHESYLVVMEGHMRLTAYLIAPDRVPVELEVMLGCSDRMGEWGCY